MKKFLIFLTFLVFFPYTAFSQVETTPSAIAFGIKEIKTLDMYIGYIPTINKNVWGNVTLNFTPVDGVSRIVVTNIRLVVEQSSACTFEIRVNNTPCRTSNITSYITGKAQYVADFDCTNVINRSGIFLISVRPSGDVYNAHYRVWITYENNPENQTNATLNYIIQNITQTIIQNINSSRDYIIQNITQTIIQNINSSRDYITQNITQTIQNSTEIITQNINSIIDYITQNITQTIQNIFEGANISIIIDITNTTIERQTERLIENIDEVKILLFDSIQTKKYCLDNNTLIVERIANITIGNRTYPYFKSEVLNCEFGCNSDLMECNPRPVIRFGIVILILIVIGIVIYLVSRRLSYGVAIWR